MKLGRGSIVVVELDQTVGQSFALIDHLRSVDKRRVRRVFGELARKEMAAIDEGLAVFLGLADRFQGSGTPPVP